MPGHGSARGYSSCGKVATIASSREIPPCVYGSGGSPTRSRAPFSSRRPCSSPLMTSGRARDQNRAPERACAGTPRRSSRSGSRARPWASRAGSAWPSGGPPPAPPATPPTVRMSATTTSGSHSRITSRVEPAARTAATYGFSDHVLRGKHLVLRRRREPHPLALHGLPPARPRLERDLVAAPRQLRAQRDRRERVPGVAERRDEEARGSEHLRELADHPPRCSPGRRRSARRSACPRPASRYTSSRSRTRSRGPTSATVSISSGGIAAAASSFLPSRYRSWISRAASSNP